MDSRLWGEATRIFAEAVDLDEAERIRLIDQACRDHPALKELVERLLAADLDPATLLEEGPGVLHDFEAPPPPEWLGPYRIVGELGRGGMGSVLKGERADGSFARSVAIKVIRGGFDSAEVRQRFQSEVQILAGLEHPHIARLYDAGLEGERPYLVMEYVEGERIDRHCDRKKLSVEGRLELFQQVCRAVHFAHQNLVIHRDLKPSNILVGSDDRVKLLDFGIAKLSQEDPGSNQEATRVALTPEYASPEQLRGKAVSTVSDVYSLGIVLYEMLTGRRPVDARPGDLAAAVESTSREPVSPSTVVTRPFESRAADGSTKTVTPESVGAARGISPKRLQRVLKGDLDQIVLKALRPDPSSRYPSAEAFADDVGRYLAGLPVTARPDALGYRASRFVRRHRFAVSALAAAALALLAAAGVATWQANVAASERDSAEQAYSFLEDLLTSPDPFRDQGVRADSVRMIDFLDYAAARIDQDLNDDPVTRARMLSTLGAVYLNLGRLSEAVPLLTEAVETREALGGNTTDLAEAQLALGFALDQNGRREEGESWIRQGMGTLEAGGGIGTLETARGQELLARSLMDSRRLDEAEPLARASHDTRRNLLGDDDPEVARSSNLLGALLSMRGDNEAAIPWIEEAVDILRRAQLAGNPDFALTLANLAALYQRVGRVDDADRAATEALETLRGTLGENHMFTGATMERLAGIRAARGFPEDADTLFQKAIATLDRVAGDNINTIAPLGNYAVFLRQQGRLAEAEAIARRSRERSARVLGEEHPLHFGALQRLGAILRVSGRPGEALPLITRAAEGFERSLGKEHVQTQETAIDLALTWLALNRRGDAERLLREIRAAAAERGEEDRIATLADEALAQVAASEEGVP